MYLSRRYVAKEGGKWQIAARGNKWNGINAVGDTNCRRAGMGGAGDIWQNAAGVGWMATKDQ